MFHCITGVTTDVIGILAYAQGNCFVEYVKLLSANNWYD